MRKRFWIPCLLVLIGCLVLLLASRHAKKPELPKHAATVNPSNQVAPSKLTQHSAANSHQSLKVPPPEAMTNIVYVETSPGKSNAINAHLLSQWQAPIKFYGKVVDENSNAVAGANIHFSWQEIPAKDAMRTLDTISTGDGLFSLQNARGWTLSVSVSKPGYYSSQKDNDSYFRYGSLGGGKFSPDPLNPVIFYLRKKGLGTQLIAIKRNYRIPLDGTPVSINLETGATATAENGNIVVQCWTQDSGKRSDRKYNWRCVVSIPDGGAITNNDEFPFEAPKEGYKPSLEISMPADSPDWQEQADLKFYYRLGNGLYGRMTFSMVAFGQHFCMIDSVLNPTGSRNLEPTQ